MRRTFLHLQSQVLSTHTQTFICQPRQAQGRSSTHLLGVCIATARTIDLWLNTQTIPGDRLWIFLCYVIFAVFWQLGNVLQGFSCNLTLFCISHAFWDPRHPHSFIPHLHRFLLVPPRAPLQLASCWASLLHIPVTDPLQDIFLALSKDGMHVFYQCSQVGSYI